MPIILRRIMIVLSTTLLTVQVFFMPISIVYAGTTIDTEEQEQVELPPMKNYLEKEQASEPRFFFTHSRMQRTAEEPVQVTFFSDQEVSEVQVFLPEEAKLLKDQLPIGISVEEGAQPNEWIVQSKRAQNTFVLPLIFEEAGNYELSVEETTAHLEISEQEEPGEEVPIEETGASDEEPAGQEDLKEENHDNEQSKEEVREPVAEAPQEQQNDEASQVVEPTVFDGQTADVTTMAEFIEAVANPDIGIISVQANLTAATINILRIDRPLLVQGNGYTLTFGNNGFYFLLQEVVEASAFRIENATLTKVGVTPLINATVGNGKNWTVELEDIAEVNANTMQLAYLPEGSIHFTGGVSNFTRTTSAQPFIEAKEVLATKQAEVTISRGNATVFFSNATVADPKITVEQGATVTITTTAGVANTIELRGASSEISIQSNGQLTVNTIGPATTTTPSDTRNNTIVLSGISPKVTVSQGSVFSISTTLSKRGIHLVGDNAQLVVSDSELSVTSAAQAAINITGAHSSFSSENGTIQLVSTTGITTNITGESPQIIFDSSMVSFISTTGQRINLIGAKSLVSISSTELTMNASTGRGIFLQGETPQVLMENSHLLMSDTGASQGMILQGTDALLSLSNQSELAITGAGSGTTENIQIGNDNVRPELSVTDGSKISITTTSGTAAATVATNNAINLRGNHSKLLVSDQSQINIDITSGFKNGIMSEYIHVIDNSKLSIYGTGSGIKQRGHSTVFEISDHSNVDVDVIGVAYEVYSTEISAEFSNKNNATINLKSSDNITMYIQSIEGSDFIIDQSSKVFIDTVRDSSIFYNFYGAARWKIEGILEVVNESESQPAISFLGQGNMIEVENGGTLKIIANGDGVKRDPGNDNRNQAIYYRGGSPANTNEFRVRGLGSSIDITATNGAAIDMQRSVTSIIEVDEMGSFIVDANTASASSGVFYGGALEMTVSNPLFFDFRNNNKGMVFDVNNSAIFNLDDSPISLWKNSSNINSSPDLIFPKTKTVFSGANFNTISDTSRPDLLNTETLGTNGLIPYTRISSTNSRWAIADELRVPTNADKKIHGRVSIPEGLYASRPSWDDEAIVTVEVIPPTGQLREYTAKTVGDSDESPGISIYGEEPRGGLFEIDLDEPLEAGSRVRIIEVELTSGELTDGFEHQILTDTVEVFPIIPPTPAQFSSSIIAQDSTTIQGVTENLDAEVTATHNGELLNTEAVTVETNGRFTLDLSEVSLEMDDEIQVFLRDAEGSAVAAGVINPPETNNTRGNINPATELTFHDVSFEPATTLIVGDLGPVSPVDPLDPEIEVDPENKPELPEDQGQLSIDFVSSFNFGSQVISVHDQTYYALSQRLLNEDGTVNETEERPNYVQISDRRSENERNGWELAVTQKEQFKGENNQVLNGASITLSNQQVITAQGGTAPGLQSVPCELVPGNRRTLLKAQGNEGTGTWIYRFGDSETAGESVTLNVPKGATPEATTYSTTLVWELSAVPDN
ncbi:WxL domain-containing protein [Enterococcus casseliflavus]|uniref:WxL domain-containing protein n=1 Tax=Enterococcus casseliflavus TaxID=37734 RepID=UPI001E4D8B69|nr:WxL domain-containing protein [Enterococcus casseliflavus]